MANQPPPARPWFRLVSIGRPAPAAAPAPPAPEPVRPPMPRPAFLSNVQTAPPQETVAPPPPPLAPSGTSVPGVASLPTSPVKTIPTATAASPKTKPTAPPPSPLVLPPAKLKSQVENEPKIPPEAEQKIVLVQKTIEKPKGWSNGDSHKEFRITNGNEESYKGGERNGHRKKLASDSDKRSFITITGENRGAVMELIQSPRKHGFEVKPHHLQEKGNSTNNGEELRNYSSSSSSDAEDGKHKMKEKDLKSKAKAKAKPTHAYVNSNVQGVNSSLVYNSTCDFHDPGVRLTLPRRLTGGGGHGNGHGNGKNN